VGQRSERAPHPSKFSRPLTRLQTRVNSRLGLRLTGSSGSPAVGPTIAFLEQVGTRLQPALHPTRKIDARVAAPFAWSIWGLSMALTAVSLFLLALNLYHPDIHVFDFWVINTVMTVGCSAVGAVIASRCPENLIGWIFCAIGLASAVRHFGAQYAIYALLAAPSSLPAGEALAWIASWLWVLYLGLYVVLGLLFPNGRLPTRRWWWVAWLNATVVLAGAISVAFAPGPVYGLGPIQNPLGFELFGTVDAVSMVKLILMLVYALGLAMAISLFVRLRRTRGVERQQLKWFVYAVAIALSGAIPEFVVFPAINLSVPWASWVDLALVVVGIGGIPIAVGIAILKYRLYDIDAIINRTLVYGALSASVVGIYMLTVGGLGALLQASGNFMISLLATGLVAVLFQPLRSRLQRGVNHLMYGERDEPYSVLSRLGQCLEATLAPDVALKTMVETIARALKLPYAAIALKRDEGYVSTAEYGTPVDETVVLPLVHRTEPVGRLIVAPRTPGESFTSSDRRLLDDLARQAGAAVQAVRLTLDLQRSRERLVATREEERRRMRRDLHDGLGPTLAGLNFGLDAARNLLTREPEGASALLAQLKGQTQEATTDVRRLVYGLRPPALDDLGLVSAIRQQATRHGLLANGLPQEAGGDTSPGEGGLVFSIEAPQHLPSLPAAVEVACYRIAQEAMTNVARHAKAHACRVRIWIDEVKDSLELEVVDDGVGLSEDRRAGVGMASMRERAAELGGTCEVAPAATGGTRVLARLPMPDQQLMEHDSRQE
jgi:two-component system NarL family sensor kinase